MNCFTCFLIAVPFLFVSAFASVEGLLHVDSSISYQKGRKTLTVPAGDYKTVLKVKNSSMTLKFKDQAGDKHKIKMAVPRHSVPSRNGGFHYASVQIEQPFDLSGQVATQEERTPTQSRIESCTYQHQVQVCTVDPLGRHICRMEYQTVPGHQQVLFHYLTATKSTQVNFEGANDRSILGNFIGTQTSQRVIHEHVGPCY